jgi:hypothetical protein
MACFAGRVQGNEKYEHCPDDDTPCRGDQDSKMFHLDEDFDID